MKPNEDSSQSLQHDKANNFGLGFLHWVWYMTQKFYEKGRRSGRCKREGNRAAMEAEMTAIWLHTKIHEQDMGKTKCFS